MKKKYEKYFGRNIGRTIYVIGTGSMLFGAFNVIFGNPYGGSIFCTIGVILFFVTSHKQVSDKHIDEIVQKAEDAYLAEKVDGKIIGKQSLKASDFSVFSGFIRDSGDVRFKTGRDQKIRTSRFFVTAISAEKNNCKIFTTVYDILSDKTPVDRMICTKDVDSVEFTKEKIEFPHGNYKCTVKTTRGDKTEELMFYLPDDALADKLTERIKVI